MANARRDARRRRQDELDAAFESLGREAPDCVGRAILWLRKPAARWLRWPIAILLIAGGLMWFLPVVSIEMLPLGVMLVAQDVPLLRRPAGLLALWFLDRWVSLREWWARGRQPG
jgi:hypothetical protein